MTSMTPYDDDNKIEVKAERLVNEKYRFIKIGDLDWTAGKPPSFEIEPGVTNISMSEMEDIIARYDQLIKTIEVEAKMNFRQNGGK